MSKQHARLSPSFAPIWTICPAAPDFAAKYPDVETEDSRWGDECHGLLATALDLDMDSVMHHDSEMAKTAQAALDYVLSVRESLEASGDPVSVWVEHTVDPSPFTGHGEMEGSMDVGIYSAGVLVEVIDLKTGFRRVDPDSPQLIQYLIGFLADLGFRPGGIESIAATYPNMVFRTTVVQPRATLADGLPEIRSKDWTPEEIVESVRWLQERALETDQANPPFAPGEEQCRKCNGGPHCSARLELTEEKLGVPLESMEEGLPVVDVRELTMDQKLRLMNAAAAIRGLLGDVEADITQRLERREPIPGWKLVRGNGRRGWIVDDNEELVSKLKNRKLKKEQIFDLKRPRSPAQILGDPSLTEKQRKSIEKLVTKKPGGLKLARDTDPRPNALPGAEMFNEPEGQPQPDLSFLD